MQAIEAENELTQVAFHDEDDTGIFHEASISHIAERETYPISLYLCNLSQIAIYDHEDSCMWAN